MPDEYGLSTAKMEGEPVEDDGEGSDEDIPSELLEFIEENNLVDRLDDSEGEQDSREKVGADIQDQYDTDKLTMTEWERKYKRALKLAQMQPEAEKKTFPFDGASTAMLPFVQEAMIDFNARTAPELVYTREVVNIKIYGQNTDEKEERARRVGIYMNYQLSENIPMWRRNQDKLLLALPCVGTVYKKTYWDNNLDEVCSELVLADQVIFDMECSSFEEAPEHFQPRTFTRNELICFIRGVEEWDISIDDDLDDDEKTYSFIEAHCWHDLDGDDLEEPYMFMYWPEKSKIVYMSADYEESDIVLNSDNEVIKIKRCEKFTQYQFIPDPEGGPMGLGWGILMGPMFNAINTNVRQLIDGGTLANTAANSGLIATSVGKGRGARNQAGPVRVKLGQLTPLDAGGMSGSLRDNVVQFPFAGPNVVLFQLMEYLVDSARQLTASAKQVDVNANQAASLYLAQLQQALKIPNAITMRVYGAATEEFKKIFHLNELYYDDDKYNRVIDMQGATESEIPQQPGVEPAQAPAPVSEPEPSTFSMQSDFDADDCDIRMSADPSQGSQMERAARADAVYQMALAQPQPIIDIREATIDVLEAMGAVDIDTLAPKPDPNAKDPMQELMIAQMQMEAEFRQRDQMLREQDQMLKAQKMMYEAALEQQTLSLQDDKLESEIVKNYASALNDIIATTQGTIDQGLSVIEELKKTLTKEEGDTKDGDTGTGLISAIKGSPAAGGEGAGGLA